MRSRKIILTAAVWAVLVGTFMVLFSSRGQVRTPRVPFGFFQEALDEDEIAEVWRSGNEIHYRLNSGGTYTTLGSLDDELQKQLSTNGVIIRDGAPEDPWLNLLMGVIPFILFLVIVVWFFRRAGRGSANVMQLRKSRARLLPDVAKVTFADVAGCAEAKDALSDAMDFLKNPARWGEAGARLPRGILLDGPPGTGKTLLARAVAGETNAKFYAVSASEFLELFVGVGAARVRDTFETAVRNAPAVIFIDEIDAIGRRRGAGIGFANDEREQTLNQLLVCLDGFEPNQKVIVIAATNRSDILDPALVRAGRFDRRVKMPALTQDERRNALDIHLREKTVAPDFDTEQAVMTLDGYTGAQIESVANHAAVLALRGGAGRKERGITMDDFRRAIDYVKQTAKLTATDLVLVESASHLAEPVGPTKLRALLKDGAWIEGSVIWADATYIKLCEASSSRSIILPKDGIARIEPLMDDVPLAEVEVHEHRLSTEPRDLQ